MEENKNIPTTEGEAIAPEAPVTDIPGTDAPSPDLTAGVPQQEQAGATMTEPGDVVVSFDKIEELMAERRAAARDTVEKAEPAAPEVDAPAVEPVDPIPDAKAAEKATEEKPQEEVAAEQKKSRRGRPPKAEKAEQAAPEAGKEQTAAKPRRGRPPKADKAAPDEATPTKRDKLSRSGKKAAEVKAAPEPEKAPPENTAPAPEQAPPEPAAPPRPVEEGKLVYLKLSEMHPFHTFRPHPFKVRDDAKMQETVASIKANGVMVPGLARPEKDGNGYEIVAGHRRCHASQRAGVETMPCIVRDMDDDTAIILMVDSNCQREHILPSEKAKAYEMKLEAIRRKAGRPSKENSRQVVGDFESADLVGQASGESGRQVQRFIRLNKLTPELMKMVDDGKLKTTPAVELSYLTPEEQEDFLSYMESEGCTPSLSQAQKLKEASKESVLTSEKIQHIMAAKPPSVKPRDPQLMIPVAKVERYFPKGFTSDQMQQVIVKLLENYARAHQHGSR